MASSRDNNKPPCLTDQQTNLLTKAESWKINYWLPEGDQEGRGCRQMGKAGSFLGKILILRILTRKRFIFGKMFTKQRVDFRVTFRRLERAQNGACE